MWEQKRNRKSIAVIILMTILFTLWVPIVSYGIVTPAYEENFNDETVGNFPISSTDSSVWRSDLTGLGAQIVERSAGNNYLKLTGAGTADKTVSAPKLSLMENGTTLSSNNMIVSFKFNYQQISNKDMIVVRTANGNVPINIDIRSTTGNSSTYKLLYKQGPITASAPYGTSIDWGVALSKGTWYKMIFSANASNTKFDVYVADEQNNLIAKKENIEVRYDTVATGEVVNFDVLQFGNVNLGTIVSVDDISFVNDPDYVFPVESTSSPSPSVAPSLDPSVAPSLDPSGEPVQDIIVNVGGTGYTQTPIADVAYANRTTGWVVSTDSLVKTHNGSNSKYTSGGASIYARYRPNIAPENAGRYNVYYDNVFTISANSVAMDYHIRASGQNQAATTPLTNVASRRWSLLGTYEFSGGSDEYVHVQGKSGQWARVSAVKFELAATPTPSVQPSASASANPTPSPIVSAQPGTVIIDDGAPGYSQYSTGTITTNTENIRDTLQLISYGGTLRDFNPGAVGQYAKYEPNVTGNHDVYLYVAWSNAAAFTNDVTVEVSYLNGGSAVTDTAKLNQAHDTSPRQWSLTKGSNTTTVSNGSWLKVGTYELGAGSYVKYTNNVAGTTKRMIADAVAFVPAGGTQPANVYTHGTSPSPLPFEDTIVSCGGEGYTESSGWLQSSIRIHDSVTASKYTTSSSAWARFNPNIKPADAGKYRVYYYNVYTNTEISYQAKVRASGQDNSLQSSIKTVSSPQWSLVGEYEFDGNGNEYFEIKGNGSNYARSTSVKFELVKPASTVPIVQNVVLKGNFMIGSEVLLEYIYFDFSNDAESESTYKLYSVYSPDATVWTEVLSGTSNAQQVNKIKIPASVNNQYIKVGVVPKNDNPEDAGKSEEVFSIPIGPIVSEQFRPTAETVTITGKSEVGSTLTANYQYKDLNFDLEKDSAYQWLIADNQDSENWTVLLEGTCVMYDTLEYTVSSDDMGKYIKFSIIPKNDGVNGVGNEVFSNVVGPVTVSIVKPVISGAKLDGQIVGAHNLVGAAVDGLAEVNYTYTHANGITENVQQTKFQWYKSSTPNGTPIPIEGATEKTYKVRQEDRSTYIKVGITPVASDGDVGDEFISNGLLVKWKLAFYDEFDYEAANGYDAKVLEKWNPARQIRPIGTPTIYQIRIPDNLEFKGGKLIIHQRKEHLAQGADGRSFSDLDAQMGRPHEWTTGNLISKSVYGPQGYYEANYKYAYSTALNQSFWAMTDRMGMAPDATAKKHVELDFNEGHFPKEMKSNLHHFDASGKRIMYSIGHYPIGTNNYNDLSKPNLGTAFHKYGGYYEQLDPSAPYNSGVNADNFRIFFDDKQVRSTRGSEWHSDPVKIYLTIAIYPGFAGPWNSSTVNNSKMEVEYVRYYEPLPVTKEDLQQYILSAQELVDNAVVGTRFGNYSQSAVSALNSLITAAQAVFAKTNPTQDEINNAVASLTDGVEVFRTTMVGDRSALSEIVQLAESLLAKHPSGTGFLECAPSIFNALKEATDLAKVVLNSPYPTQSAIDEKVIPIQTMIERFANGVNFVGTATNNNTIDLRQTSRVADITVPANLNPQILLPDTTLNTIVINREISGKGIVTISIPTGATLSGEFLLPNDAMAESELYNLGYSVVMSGLQSTNDKLIRIEFSQSKGSKIGIIELPTGSTTGNITEITKTISQDTQDIALATIGSEKAVKFDSSNGWVLYAKTTYNYVVYKEKTTESPTPSTQPTPTPTPGGGTGNYQPGTNMPGGVITLPPTLGLTGVKFNDISSHWAEREIKALAKDKIITGRDENEFAPEESVSRAEFATMIRRALKLNPVLYLGQFNDVQPGDWFANDVAAIADSGIMEGLDGYFRPNDLITREEIAKVVVNAYMLKTGVLDIADPEISFDDEMSEWAKPYIAKAVALNLMTGMGNNEFGALLNATRAQSAVVIYRLFK